MLNCIPSRVRGDRTSTSTEYGIVTREADLHAAFRLVHHAYVRIGLMLPNEYEMRVTPFHLLPTTEVVSATVRDEMACTATIVGDGLEGLPMDSVYATKVDSLRAQQLRLAEVSCLAERRSDIRRTFPMLSRVMSLIAQIAKSRGIDNLLVAVHPRHGRFYQRYFGFERLGDQMVYPSVRNRPAVALSLDLNNLSEHFPDGYQRLFGTPFPDHVLRRREVAADVLQRLRPMVAACYPRVACESESLTA